MQFSPSLLIILFVTMFLSSCSGLGDIGSMLGGGGDTGSPYVGNNPTGSPINDSTLNNLSPGAGTPTIPNTQTPDTGGSATGTPPSSDPASGNGMQLTGNQVTSKIYMGVNKAGTGFFGAPAGYMPPTNGNTQGESFH